MQIQINLKKEETVYDTAHIEKLCQENKIDEAKAYIKQYLYRCNKPVGVFVYDVIDQQYDFHLNQDIASNFLPKGLGYDVLVGKRMEFVSLYKWFMNENHDRVRIATRIDKPRYFEEKGQKFINFFGGYKHNYKPYDAFSSAIKNKVNKLLKHIKTVWANERNDVYEYVINWLATSITLRKVKTALYLRSGQGTGKSIVTEFIQQKVLTRQLCLITDSPESLTGWNEMFKGKILLVFEELPATGKEAWRGLDGKFKNYITGCDLEIRQRFKDAIFTDNIGSYIISSNHLAILIAPDDRRYAVLDINEKFKGNYAYFDDLAQDLDDETGEAFFCYLYEHARKNLNWQENRIPRTDSKQEMIIETLPRVFKYIKETYLKRQKDMKLSLDLFCKNFNAQEGKDQTTTSIAKILKTANIIHKKKKSKRDDGGQTTISFLDYTYDELLQIFKNKNWIHETDDIDMNEEIELDFHKEIKEIKRMQEIINQRRYRKPKKVKKQHVVIKTTENTNLFTKQIIPVNEEEVGVNVDVTVDDDDLNAFE
ncbi:MAG: hypothetical protein IPM51_12270 [Sphingobacteriaceae bacterium]|nr:hypothetical protein [Sphingobacteriaceae bacterium]